ncbi:hypothetical protein J6590_093434 [Homalodisca vitripennis]|nr:hypothetical protein J6590_093434 [Homalodisca vitripennis]
MPLTDVVLTGHLRSTVRLTSHPPKTGSGALSLKIPIHRTKTYNRSFTVTACTLWNSLPNPVKQIESRERFVAELRRRYLDRYRAVPAEGAELAGAEQHRIKRGVS